jgi:manganese/zinc/iron transport system ATP- binding protein
MTLMEDGTARPLIAFRSAALGYGRKRILSDISFSIEEGEFFGIVGPNGAGKTTIVRTILGMIPPLGGEVRVGGGEGLRLGYVPQRDAINSILPYTGWEVVMMGRYRQMGPLRRPAKSDQEAVREGLLQVDAMGFACRPFGELSGGQKQRVLIARALASHSEVLILDEPTNGMDLASRVGILALIRRLHTRGLTVILVSHLLDDVANYVQRLAIVQEGSFLVGDVAEILTAQNLSTLYSLPVEVEHIRGNTVILPGRGR